MKLPHIARYVVTSTVPPNLTEGLFLSEKIRSTLLKISNAHPVFLGKNSEGQISTGHQHAYILPEANGRDGKITHLSIYAKMGFDTDARYALEQLNKVWGHGGHDVRLILIGMGESEDFAGLNRVAGQSLLLGTSRFWISRTPFISTRHPKTYRNGQPKLDNLGIQIGSPEHDLRRLLEKMNVPDIVNIETTNGTILGDTYTRWLKFQTQRKLGNGRRVTHSGSGFKIEFAEAWQGPLTLGYGAHFGLGVFETTK